MNTPTAERPLPDIDRPAAWQDQGACVNHPEPDLWFPTRGQDTRPARTICNACPVKTECLEHALATNEKYGIWGGTSERERRRLRRARRTTHRQTHGVTT